MQMIRSWIRRKLQQAGYVVFNTRTAGIYAHDGLFTFNGSPFLRDPRFQAAYSRGVAASRGADPGIEWRLHVALWAAQCAAQVDGDFLECGVNTGFISSGIMQRLDWNKIGKCFVLVDTFNGPVLHQFSDVEVLLGRKEVAEHALRRGAYATHLEPILANYAEWPNVRVVQGTVPNVLDQLKLDRIAFLHLDDRAVRRLFGLPLRRYDTGHRLGGQAPRD